MQRNNARPARPASPAAFESKKQFSFRQAQSARAGGAEKAYRQLFSGELVSLQAATGFVHAYDLTHLPALAIQKDDSLLRVPGQ